jgi:uncharacterized protein YcfJ
MIVWDIIRGKFDLREFLTPVRIHHAIVGALSFAFIAAGIGEQFSDSYAVLGTNTFVIAAAVAGGLAGKVLVI